MQAQQKYFRSLSKIIQVMQPNYKKSQVAISKVNPINIYSAFCQTRFTTTLYLNYAQFPELITFDLTQIKMIWYYEESYLNQIFRSKMPMTNN